MCVEKCGRFYGESRCSPGVGIESMFSLIIDELTKSVQDKALRIMTFADDVVLPDDNTNVLQGKHERWQEILEKKQTENKWRKTEFSEFRFKNKTERNGSDRNVRGRRLINKV